MKIVFYLVLALIAFLAQLILTAFIEIKGIRPDFLLLVVLWISVQEGQFSGTLAGFGLGLMQDIFETQFIGLSALTKSIVGFGAALMPLSDLKTSRQRMALTLFLASLIHDWLFYEIKLIHIPQGFFSIFIAFVLPGAIYTTLIGLLILKMAVRQKWTK
ncbi:rod shape-determining protein MreD [candidate division KSB1 bacterium]|nr:rod shape-determining protein MreD [candidate division KSB1 bacterium]